MIEFKMPSLGADMEAGTLTDWLVKPGDPVKRGDIIAVVDTQKGLIDIEVFDEGTINELLIKENEKVPVGTVMALIAPGKEVVVKKEEETPAIIEKENIIAEKVTEQKAVEEFAVAEIPHGIKESPLKKVLI
jgi:pyruvate dehydrogenase E2 component (dihydrolipoamide acetyltransferase)